MMKEIRSPALKLDNPTFKEHNSMHMALWA